MKGFARLTPMIPGGMIANAKDVVDEIVKAGIVQPMDINDVIGEVKGRLLTLDESISLLRWWCVFVSQGGDRKWRDHVVGNTRVQVAITDGALDLEAIPPEGSKEDAKSREERRNPDGKAKDRLLKLRSSWLKDRSASTGMAENSMTVNNSLSSTGAAVLRKSFTVKVIRLSDMRYYLNPKVISPDLPLPTHVLPFEITQTFTKSQLDLLGWCELPLVDWVQFVVNEVLDLEVNPHFAEKVLGTVGRAFMSGNMSVDSKTIVVSILENKTLIPTRKGMRLPRHAYFKNVTLFDDLPVVHLSQPKAVNEIFLKELGVRDHVDLQIVLDRLQVLDWDHVELVKYLASVQSKLTEPELRKLQTTPMFPKDGESADAAVRYRADQLYFPEDSLRNINMPLLAWPKGRLRPNTDEGKIMTLLGLQKTVPLEVLLGTIAATTDTGTQAKLLNYFIDNHRTVYANVYHPSKVPHKFLPVQNSGVLANPLEVFADPQCAVMGYLVLKENLRPVADQFGVRQRPDVNACVERLRTKPPQDAKEAEAVFSWLANRVGEFSKRDWAVLAKAKIVPVRRKVANGKELYSLQEPENVYFAGGGDSVFLEDLDIIDFGPSANVFLRACGVLSEPSPLDIARKVLQNPPEYLQRVKIEKYIGLIRKIATLTLSSTNLLSDMTRVPWLIGFVSEGVGDDQKVVFKLGKAGDIYLVDDSVLKQLFNPLTCPMETLMEEFYERLGSKWLSRCVTEQLVPVGSLAKTTRTKQLQELIHSRAPLLMYDASGRHSRDILPEAQQTLQNLVVSEVREIEVRRTFHGILKSESTSACLGKDKAQKTQWYLLVSSKQPEDPLDRHLSSGPNKELDTVVENKVRNVMALFPDAEEDAVRRLLSSSDEEEVINRFLDQGYPKAGQIDPRATSKPTNAEARDTTVSNPPMTQDLDADGSLNRLYDNVKSWLGMDSRSRHSERPTSVPGAWTTTPPMVNPSVQSNTPDRPPLTVDPGFVTRLRANLERSIESLRPAAEGDFEAIIPPEQADDLAPGARGDFCNPIQASDLVLVGEVNGVQVFCEKGSGVHGSRTVEDMLADGTMARFIALLGKLAINVFGMKKIGVIKVWWDSEGAIVAYHFSLM
ncbi:hypothetical protein HDU93_006635 [Gonapodya sp. JEL0774]|nr:hypothetical protein HDU93_006635 [Gonapodya sp. JEL0774]